MPRKRKNKRYFTQITEIAKEKLPDLNCSDIDSAIKQIEGSARAMGLEVVE